MLGCGFFVFDFDPFIGGGLRYRLGKSQRFYGSHDRFMWEVEWEDQNIRPRHPDTNPIFKPIALHDSMRHYADPERFAPWRRLM
jgi:hypothetical protein